MLIMNLMKNENFLRKICSGTLTVNWYVTSIRLMSDDFELILMISVLADCLCSKCIFPMILVPTDRPTHILGLEMMRTQVICDLISRAFNLGL